METENPDLRYKKPNSRRISPDSVVNTLIDLTTGEEKAKDGEDKDVTTITTNNKRLPVENGIDNDVHKKVKMEPSSIEINEADTQMKKADKEKLAEQKKLSHFRYKCRQCPFYLIGGSGFASIGMALFRGEHPLGPDENREHCPHCMCYVCDKPASECQQWYNEKCLPTSHCFSHPSYDDENNDWDRKRNQELLKKVKEEYGSGPYKPGHAIVSEYPSVLTKCCHCGWYTRTKNFLRINNDKYNKWPGVWDWCMSCGRVAKEQDLRKQQTMRYKPQQGDLYLGTKFIPFRLHTRDPRQMKTFAPQWKEHEGEPGWKFDPVEAEIEYFEHMLGRRPNLSLILYNIPIVKEADIPMDGACNALDHHNDPKIPSADETQAIILDDPSHATFLHDIYRVNVHFGQNSDDDDRLHFDYADLPPRWLHGDIKAAWNPDQRSGIFRVQCYIRGYSKFQSQYHPFMATSLARFMANFYGLAPFQLSEVMYNCEAEYEEIGRIGKKIPVPPFELETDSFEELKSKAKANLKNRLKVYNESLVDYRNSHYSLGSGSRSSILGGLSSGENSLRGILSRYLREILPECIYESFRNSWRKPNSFFLERCGATSTHRNMRRFPKRDETPATTLDEDPEEWLYFNLNYAVDSFLTQHDYATAMLTYYDAKRLKDKTSSLAGLMHHLESRGHTAAPYVEGLTVELLPFQSQTLQWALERETIPGGIQSFWWAKLPNNNGADSTRYYNPILGRISSEKPQLVRGGIIAEAMGLGKTVISLALILRNPAPALPAPGSHSSLIPALDESSDISSTAFRDPDLYGRTSKYNGKRGSIVSHGTLVVCNVSLVGQWVAEAKSKLKNPGLVYSYYGQSRKRDPLALAQNAIVVTTYETLASDATYHANKSSDASYCPPCEQVRWWRIICDESHVLRNGNNAKSKALMNLVGDNKWLVSGTPVNTSIMDLHNQLKFLGIQDHDYLMNLFQRTVCHYIHDPKEKFDQRFSLPGRGVFTFLMRSIMMRHSHEQKYSGTDTTLMSLPAKNERIVTVEFSPEERIEYDALESAAQRFYERFKTESESELSRYFLKLSQKLMPMRAACSGGQVPLLNDDVHDKDITDGNVAKVEEDCDDHELVETKQRSSKMQKFPDFIFTSKLHSLISELKNVREKDDTSKCLVFSQFQSTLNWLKEELPKHGFQYRSLSGDMTMSQRTKALRDFQNDPPTTIFLLSMRAGAVGINLTQANVVFLMEPCFNPALEAQAIGRVWRLGQQRQVEIVRLRMKDSIEGRICQMLKKKYHGKTNSSETPDVQKSEEVLPEVPDTLVGSIRTDKSYLMESEFDLLFGVGCSSDIPSDSEDEDSDDREKDYGSTNSYIDCESDAFSDSDEE